ncbi:hypothetical protein [Bacillus sp. LLTC93]|uniref:hypothetical protein n=1 Tax=Bacillus sp. LLTC93 TaxID=2108274 RepID=UPI001CB949D6|nr:hypothetical protein [Bacillus sp. LLTC93]
MSISFGGWEFQDMEGCNLPQPVATAFSKAFEGFVGVQYVPVLYVASQLVSGNNYCIICKTTATTNPPIQGCKVVIIYADLEGNAHITNIHDVIH